MQSTVQCKDSDQCLLGGEVAVHAEHCQNPWIYIRSRITSKSCSIAAEW